MKEEYEEESKIVSRSNLVKYAREICKTGSDPKMISMLEEIHSEPTEEKRLAKARELGTVRCMAERGVTLPDTSRMSLRTFEDPNQPRYIDDFGSPKPTDPSTDDEWVFCFSVGLVVCYTLGETFTDIIQGKGQPTGES